MKNKFTFNDLMQFGLFLIALFLNVPSNSKPAFSKTLQEATFYKHVFYIFFYFWY